MEELRKANRELEEYAYVSSHDLQEPLRTVHIHTQLLMREVGNNLSDRAKQSASFVQEGVKRMQQLIRDLLQFSRVVSDSAKEDATPPTADLNLCFEKALLALASRLEETQALVTAPNLPMVHGEEGKLTLVFQNLLSNSLKYRNQEKPPRIEVSTRQELGHGVTCVQDNGIGFEPQYAKRISDSSNVCTKTSIRGQV